MDIETLNISILPFPFFSPIQNQGFEDFLMYYVIKAELVEHRKKCICPLFTYLPFAIFLVFSCQQFNFKINFYILILHGKVLNLILYGIKNIFLSNEIIFIFVLL